MVALNYIFSFGLMGAFLLMPPILLIAFCGPMGNSVTTVCRKLFLRTYGSKMKMLWYNLAPIYGFLIFGLVCRLWLYWTIAAFFAMLIAFTWFFRLWLLMKFPHRGYLRQPFALVRENGQLRVIFNK